MNAPVEQATLPLESQLEARFGRFDEEHPEIWELFERFTFELIKGGHRHYGAAAIFERIRWHMTVTSRNSGFKLNNDFRAYYARKFHQEHPEHDGFFRTRQVRGESD